MHIAMHAIRKRIRAIAFGLAATGMVFANVASVAAADLTAASLELSDPRTDETGVTYTFDASSFSTGTTINCIQLELNTQADGGGSAPSSITTTSSALDASTDIINDGSWTVDNSSNGTLGATFGAGETPTGASGQIVWTGVDNGDTEGTYYGLFNTYANVDCSTGGPVDSVTVAFIYNDGQLVQMTVDPTLTFTCTSLAASTAVNGTNTTFDPSGCTGIDYSNNVTSSNNEVAGHNLNVATNANGGYVVYVRTTGALTNQSSDTIDNHTGTNGSPSSFPGVGTESFGYTTEDSSLSGGTADRFTNPANGWSGFTTSNEEIMDDTDATPGAGDDVEVAHQVGIASDTEAGLYQTTLIYTVVATF